MSQYYKPWPTISSPAPLDTPAPCKVAPPPSGTSLGREQGVPGAALDSDKIRMTHFQRIISSKGENDKIDNLNQFDRLLGIIPGLILHPLNPHHSKTANLLIFIPFNLS